jgi:hypothetical protein
MTTKTRRRGSLLVASGSNGSQRSVAGPGGAMPSAKHPSFDQLRLVLSAIPGMRPDALKEAASALAAGKPYRIYRVMLTEEDLRRLGLSA